MNRDSRPNTAYYDTERRIREARAAAKEKADRDTRTTMLAIASASFFFPAAAVPLLASAGIYGFWKVLTSD